MNWKRTTGRTPALNARVLVWNGKQVSAARKIIEGKRRQWRSDGWSQILGVTHWQPMLAPPGVKPDETAKKA